MPAVAADGVPEVVPLVVPAVPTCPPAWLVLDAPARAELATCLRHALSS